MTIEHDEYISSMVRGGYMTAAEIADAVVEAEIDDTPGAEELIATVRTSMEQRRRHLEVAGTSSYERLRRAFDQLAESGVLARENYLCCQTCAYAAIDEEIGDAVDRGEAVRGYVLFHSQDTDRAVETGILLLRYGGSNLDPELQGAPATKKIGEEIVAVLKAAAFEPEWSGSPDGAISLSIAWDKRPPADSA